MKLTIDNPLRGIFEVIPRQVIYSDVLDNDSKVLLMVMVTTEGEITKSDIKRFTGLSDYKVDKTITKLISLNMVDVNALRDESGKFSQARYCINYENLENLSTVPRKSPCGENHRAVKITVRRKSGYGDINTHVNECTRYNTPNTELNNYTYIRETKEKNNNSSETSKKDQEKIEKKSLTPVNVDVVSLSKGKETQKNTQETIRGIILYFIEKSGVNVSPVGKHHKHIFDLLQKGIQKETIEKVIDRKVNQFNSGQLESKWYHPAILLKPDNFERELSIMEAEKMQKTKSEKVIDNTNYDNLTL